jgi:hypothetical protein
MIRRVQGGTLLRNGLIFHVTAIVNLQRSFHRRWERNGAQLVERMRTLLTFPRSKTARLEEFVTSIDFTREARKP